MTFDGMDDETRRVRDEVVNRLERAGISTTPNDSPDSLVRLLEALESFERTVELRGGDLMVDEPALADRPIQPDDAAFVMPRRGTGETVDAYVARLSEARRRAARVTGKEARGNEPTGWGEI